MYRIYDCLAHQHDLVLVIVALLIGLGGIHTAFNLYARACIGRLRQRIAWLFLTGVVTGGGIWATHFIAMLSYDPIVPVGYEPTWTAFSLVLAIAATTAGFAVASIAGPHILLSRIVGGLVVGLGISVMHFTGMSAMQVPAVVTWHMDIVIPAILLGAVFGMISLWLAGTAQTPREKLLGKVNLTIAVATMHFSAMGALIVTPDPSVPVPAQLISQEYLAIGVAVVATLLIAIGFVTALLDRQLRDHVSDRMRILGDSAIEALVLTQNGRVIDTNESFLKLANIRREDIENQDFLSEWLSDTPPAFQSGEIAYVETTLSLRGIGELPVEVIRREIPADDISDATVIFGLRDLRERYAAEHHIRFLAEHDSLTKLLNRTTFNDRLAEALEESDETGTPVTVMCIDFDHFKELNDSYGHIAGDHALRELGERLSKLFSDEVTIARVGGDEFVALLHHQKRSTEEEIAARSRDVAQQILDSVAIPIFINTEHRAKLAASIGIAHYPNDGNDAESILFHADLAMYRVKQSGGNDLVYYSSEMDEEYRFKRQISSNLRIAMENGQLALHYQPQCEAGDQSTHSFEALLRWTDPELGSIPPGRFIPIAEETGLIIPLGEWVLRTACQEAARWKNPLGIGVNLSAVQLQKLDLPEVVANILDETGLDPKRLELEVTETALIHNPARSLKILSDIKKLGVRIAMDDFGTGYSSLATLQNFPVDRIKIDQSFIRKLVSSDQAVAIVRAVINLSRDLAMEVIAEGVETDEQASFLTDHNCQSVQGYKYGHPKPISDYAHIVNPTEATLQPGETDGKPANRDSGIETV
ncbi:bifunctional diguanylate cyclase/phosphodiesterase [Thalassospira australica]|uniref:bifunctional diguanylate cyclase/phosphodiesterase n=1 Tax=Thalassospira australica TaxID=1528106 RepID=UPI0009DE7B17|nr:bifunctional diguanylate cyclase/phosphodiesterase [Thalassospira australica]